MAQHSEEKPISMISIPTMKKDFVLTSPGSTVLNLIEIRKPCLAENLATLLKQGQPTF